MNVASVAGRLAMAPQGAYASSKWALEAIERDPGSGNEVDLIFSVAIVEPGRDCDAWIFGKARP